MLHPNRVRGRSDLVQCQLAYSCEFEADLMKRGGVLAKREIWGRGCTYDDEIALRIDGRAGGRVP